MKKLIYLCALALGSSSALQAETDLALKWRILVEEARKEAGVVSPSSHTGSFDGVHTLNPTTRFLSGEDGDAARALYQACAKLFGAWAGESEARSSTTQGSDGEMMQRIRAANGDYLSLIYRPPTAKGAQGTFSVIYVDASTFLEKIEAGDAG